MSKIDVTTTCPVCGENHILSLEQDQLKKYKEGAYIQDAFPDLPPDERELLLSGIDAACWRKAFGPDMPCDLNGYELTDDAFYQYRKHLGNRVYSLIQWDKIPNDTYEIYEAEVDLKEYSEAELEKLISSYYDSMEALVASYENVSEEEIDGIVAECIFEQKQWNDASENWNAKTEKEAKEIILEWLQSQKDDESNI